jgi:arsenate reductase (thioredoxin)
MPNVLFLCTGNSARSILAEAILNQRGAPTFRAFSAGSQPKGAVHPQALRLLAARGHDTTDLRSKSWDEFAAPDSPRMDLIFTVCARAAGEVCPVWPGHPASAHWGQPDPASAPEEAIVAAFEEAYAILERRIGALLAVPLTQLEPARLNAIGAL